MEIRIYNSIIRGQRSPAKDKGEQEWPYEQVLSPHLLNVERLTLRETWEWAA